MKRLLPLIVVLLIGGTVLAQEPTLKQQILERLAELQQLAEGLPDEPVPDPDDPVEPDDPEPDDPVEPDPDDPVEPDPDDPDPDVIDNPPTAATTQPGLWSDPSTFGNVKPGPDTHLTITHDVDLDEGTAGRVDLYARLKWLDNGTLDLHGSLVAWDGGIVEATTGRLSFHVPDDRLFTGNTEPGPLEGEPDFHPDDIGLWGMMGSDMLLRAPEVTPYVRAIGTGDTSAVVYPPTGADYGATGTVAIAGGQAVLDQEPVGWQPGDVLLLAGEHGQFKTATLDTIDSTALSYTERDDGLEFAGATTVEFEDEVYFQPVIANLSRRFVIDAPLVVPGDTHHRAHVNVGHHAHFHVQNVEFRNLGPRGKLGRYPIHTHHAHGSHGDDIAGCSVWQDLPVAADGSHRGNRGITIHRTQGVLVDRNVMVHCHGHTLFMEDQEEFGNTIKDNLVVGSAGSEEIPIVDPASGVWDRAHGFWLRAGNEISGNIAIGCGVGFVQLPQRNENGAVDLSHASVVRGSVNVGCETFGFWSTVQTDVHDSISILNGHAGFSDTPGDTRVHNRYYGCTAIQNAATIPSRAHQVLNYSAREAHEFHNGVVVGPIAFRTYGGLLWGVSGTRVAGEHFVVGGFGRFGVVLEDSTITVDKLIAPQTSAPAQGDKPIGVIGMRNVSGSVGEQQLEGMTADWTHSYMPQDGAWIGIDTGPDRQLTEILPLGGQIETHWRERVNPGSAVRYADREDEFSYTIASSPVRLAPVRFRGYPVAVPPGEYDVTVTYSSGDKAGTTETRRIAVASGEISRFQDGELIQE